VGQLKIKTATRVEVIKTFSNSHQNPRFHINYKEFAFANLRGKLTNKKTIGCLRYKCKLREASKARF